MVVRLEGFTNEPRFPRGSNRRVLAFTVVAVLRFVRQASSFLGFAVAYRARASESSLTRIRVTLPRTWLPNGRLLAAVILAARRKFLFEDRARIVAKRARASVRNPVISSKVEGERFVLSRRVGAVFSYSRQC